jgi:hypothetical protein
MKYRTKEQQREFCLVVLDKLTDKPLTLKALAAIMGLKPSQVQYAIDLLVRTSLVFHKQGKGYHKDVSIPLDRDYVLGELDYEWANKSSKVKAQPKDDKDDLGPELEFDPITKRKCRDCQTFLPASRYFKCYKCQLELSNMDENLIYVTEEFKWSYMDDELVGPAVEVYGNYERVNDKRWGKDED